METTDFLQAVPDSTVLRVEDLVKDFPVRSKTSASRSRDVLRALDGVSLEVNPGRLSELLVNLGVESRRLLG